VEVSRFSSILFLGVPGVFDYAEPDGNSRINAVARFAFSLTEEDRHSDLSVFGAQYPARQYSCLRFAEGLTTNGARLGARMVSAIPFL